MTWHSPWHLADEELVLASIAGDLEAFDELARRYRPAVSLTARQILSDPDRAADVAQDALVQAYCKLPSLREPAAFGAWLRTLTSRAARRARWRFRHEEDRLRPLDMAVVLACPNVRPDEEVVGLEAQQAVRAAIDRLGGADADVLRLRYIEGMPIGRIGSYLGLTREGAKYRLQRATRRLRRVLGSLMEGEIDDAGSRVGRSLLQDAQGPGTQHQQALQAT